MKRFTPLYALLICFVAAFLSSVSVLAASSSPDSPATSPDKLWAPVLTLPDDTTYHLCTGDSVCYPVSANDADATDTLTLSLLEGPITFAPKKFGKSFSTTVCFTPTQSGSYRFIWQVSDKGGRKDIDTVIFEIVRNTPPHMNDLYFADQQCYTFSLRRLQLPASDADGDTLKFKLLSGLGVLNRIAPQTGYLQYTPPSTGIFKFTIEVSDKCGSDTATVTDTITMNQKPYFAWTDTTLKLCTPQQVCVVLKGIDPEHGPMEIRLNQGNATLTRLTDSTSKLCFTPADKDSTYTFLVCVADLCPYSQTVTSELWPNCFEDTLHITINMNEPPVLACPPEINFGSCVPGERCFDISASDPDGDNLTYKILSSNATVTGTRICVTDTAASLTVKVEVSDSCGRKDTCSIPVKSGQAHPPVVTLPDNFSMNVCQAEEVCIDAYVSDVDQDIATVIPNFGSYDANRHKICFTADTTGTYRIILTATDQCGLTDSDTCLVSIGVNKPPVVHFAKDADSANCFSGQLCYDITITDDNLTNVWVSNGTYNAQTGQVCFTPNASGSYAIIVRATDACSKTAEDTLTVKVKLNNPPVISGLRDTTVYLCNPQYVCLPFTVTDLDKNVKSITVNRGQIQNGAACFVPYSQGTYPIIVTVTDSCGDTVADTGIVTVKTDQAITLTCPNDTSIFLCQPDTLCFPVGGVPKDAKVNVIGTAAWWNPEKQSICFYSECCLENHIKFEVTSACGTVRTCEFTVKVKTNTAPVVLLPHDTTITQCAASEVCLPVGVTDAEKNLKKVEATGGTYDPTRGVICFRGNGTYTVTVTATDSCGATGTDQATITIATNQPPQAFFGPTDTLWEQCAPAEICLPITISDGNGNIKSITSSLGQYDPAKQAICFTPNGSGKYCAQVIVTDSCNAADTAYLCVTVKAGSSVAVTCPSEEKATICKPENFCFDVKIDGTPTKITVIGGTREGNTVCVPIDTTGTYLVTVIAEGGCNTDTCQTSIVVKRQQPVDVSCPGKDTTMFLCTVPQTLSFPVTLTGDADTIRTYPQGAVYSNGRISFEVTEAGVYTVSLVAVNGCGKDSCSFKATVGVNHPPVITGSPDTTVILCGDTGYVAFTYSASDPDNNITEITSSLGIIEDKTVIFKPTAEGKYNIVLTARDACGLSSTDTVVVTVQKKPSVDIKCPDNPFVVFITAPDTVRVPLSITPANAPVVITPSGYYDWAKGEAVVYIQAIGNYNFTATVSGECNVDSCHFQIQAGQYNPPTVECAGTFDTLMCDVNNVTFCRPVKVTGTNVTVTVVPAGTYENGFVCFPASGAGEHSVMVIASNGQQADTCTTTVVVHENHPPMVTLPEPFRVSTCQTGSVCFDVDFTDVDSNITLTSVNIGQPTQKDGKVQYCFTPDTAGTYRIIASVFDGCKQADYDTTYITVDLNQPPVVDLGKDFTKRICASETVCLPLTVSDNNLATVTVTGGSYDAKTGQVCFEAGAAGLYTVAAVATDSCGASAYDTVKVTVVADQPPTITLAPDTTVYLCTPSNVCVGFTVGDADGNIKSITANRGQVNGNTVCFVPYSQGTYPVIVTVTDSCGRQAVDTAIVTVKTDQAVTLTCPNDTSIFLCQPDTLCFPVGGVPVDATVKVVGTAAWWSPEKQSICFYSECCLSNSIKFDVTTKCGTVKSCQFTVKVKTNTAPLVLLPHDTTIVQCQLGQICLPVGVTDAEKNLMKVEATGGTYDPIRNIVCFTPATNGRVTITVKATDSCGAVGTDQIVVTVQQNTKPIIIYQPADTIFSQCQLSEICLPVTITDMDKNIKTVTVTNGSYNASTGKVCFMPTDTGRQCLSVVATDDCGLKDSIQICVRVVGGGYADIVCAPIPPQKICWYRQICVPLTITGNNFTVSTSFGSYSAGQLCFQADSAGTYVIRVIAGGSCGTDTCLVTIPVQLDKTPDIVCPGNQIVKLCGPDTVCFKYSVTGNANNIKVNSGAYLGPDSTVCVPVLLAGTKTIRLVAEGTCNNDTCVFTVTSSFNSAPTVDARDTSVTVCTLSEICIPYAVTDPNGNIKLVTTDKGVVKGNSICFTPTGFGATSLTITATDSCDMVASKTITVTVLQGTSANIVCPEGDQFASLCKPDSIYIVMPITPSNATVTVTPNGKYNPATGKVAIYITTGGTYQITVIAAAPCGTDTCKFNLRVDMGQAPTVTCPGTIDTIMCLEVPDTLCFPVTVSGTGVQVVVSPSGYYSAGYVCVPVSAPGNFYLKLNATGTCGTAVCSTLVKVNANQSPMLTLPLVPTIERCPNDTTTICIDGITATDAESPVTVTKVCGPGTLTQVGSGYKICFKPASIAPQSFCIQVSDGCHTLLDTLDVNIVSKADCDVCAKVSIDGGKCTPVGLRQSVEVKIQTNNAIGGFDLLMSFDPTALSFQLATIVNTDIQGWEYFTYNLNSGNCSPSCPPGLVRLVGIADVNNGANHPPESTYTPNGLLVHLEFQVANNQNLGGQFVPVNFVWYSCADNSFSDRTGNTLYIDKRIYNSEKILIWDEDNDVAYPEASRQFGIGAPDLCLQGSGAKGLPLRCVDFYNGGVCIIHPDSIDDRGDINLNGLSYEIADAVLFSRYFIYGLSVFTINQAGQIAATDANADGLTLTVADLTHLIRVVIGDAPRTPKLSPYPEKLALTTDTHDGVVTLKTNAVSTIGTAWFVCKLGPGTKVDAPRLRQAANGMQLMYSLDGDILRMLVYDIGKARIEAGEQAIVDVPITGDLTIEKAEICDYEGRPYQMAAKTSSVPDKFALAQNYPNPFNPATTISFSLSAPTTWKLTIYNVTGSVVREFTGASDIGSVEVVWTGTSDNGSAVASGVYFYRLEAGGLTETRKMMLLK